MLVFLPYLFAAGAVLIGLPNLLGRVVPWSWLWLGYYYPIWTLLLLSLACTSLLIIVFRSVAFIRNRRDYDLHEVSGERQVRRQEGVMP